MKKIASYGERIVVYYLYCSDSNDRYAEFEVVYYEVRYVNPK